MGNKLGKNELSGEKEKRDWRREMETDGVREKRGEQIWQRENQSNLLSAAVWIKYLTLAVCSSEEFECIEKARVWIAQIIEQQAG